MVTHKKIWSGINILAIQNGYSASGLAVKAGLDATSFNKSKHFSKSGQPRWPSTESIAKILTVTKTSLVDFANIVEST
ncbi:MAG: hypothetical protein JKX72_00220 [Robiginitomaculum sp.]|nr:hypothetical protein [Robiginitomaculum sp.]